MPDQKVRPEERAALLPTVLPSRSASTSIYHTVYVQPPPALARELLTEKRRSCGRRLIHWFFIALLGYFSIMYLTSKTSHGLPYPDTVSIPIHSAIRPTQLSVIAVLFLFLELPLPCHSPAIPHNLSPSTLNPSSASRGHLNPVVFHTITFTVPERHSHSQHRRPSSFCYEKGILYQRQYTSIRTEM